MTYPCPFALLNYSQRLNCHPRGPEDTQCFEPEQKLLLQEPVENKCDVSRYRSNEVLMPRPAGVFQRLANVFLRPFLQVNDVRIRDSIRELAHVPLQLSIHCLEAAGKKFRVMVMGEDPESWIGASVRVGDEVRKGLMEGSDRQAGILPKNEKRVERQ